MKTHPYLKIIIKNTFTLFNLVNLILALMIVSVGSFKNMLFLAIAIANTLIGIINEVRAKKIVDKLKLLSEKNPTILKNGKTVEEKPENIKKGDILLLTLGNQVIFDSILEEGTLEVNESFVTGEQNNITKRPGDELISGSFVVSGSGKAKVKNVGTDNFVTKLQAEASNIKTADSKLFKLMNNIVKYISRALIPIGILLLLNRLHTESDTTTAVTSTVAALINMIPEGLILLTSSVLALATVRLGKQKVLVQDLYAVETLARVDTICLDKTGTLTTGRMTVKDYTAFEKSFETALKTILRHQMSENATTTALKQKFLKSTKFREIEGITETIPFSSDRKYSGIKTKNAEYLMGAIEFLTDDEEIIKKVRSYSSNYRVLAVVEKIGGNVLSRGIRDNGSGRSEEPRNDGRDEASRESIISPISNNRADAGREWIKVGHLLGIIRLDDEIRSDAKDIIDYFYKNDIAPKIISGDDLKTVTTIAGRVGVKDLRGVNLSTIKNKNYDKLVKEYSIFTRVKPSEKKSLVLALKKQGKTVAMTGDGVNDILAMKEADCSIAIGDGSDAARRVAKFVLLDSSFDSIPKIIDEGRRSINNLERSTTLFLTKTIYASILAVLFVFLPLRYPFTPIEMSLINFACIGLPGLVLALENNTARIKDQFVKNITKYSVPTGIIVSIACLALSIVAYYCDFTRPELATLAVFVTFLLHLALIYQISRPLNKFRAALLIAIVIIVILALFTPVFRDFFEFAHFNL